MSQVKYNDIDASPVKSFFVSMLTRDIKLDEAILDLLDNCVDGILRSSKVAGNKPYIGYWADIKFDKDSFSICDNCGGIPWDLHNYAFRMGRSFDRPTDTAGAVGVYGIGMKRAIFKMGRHCLISTRNGNDRYEVEISPEWIQDESKWTIPVRKAKKEFEYDGTDIVIGKLYPSISSLFNEDAKSFKAELERMVSTHYAFIIEKGFDVKINGESVQPRTTKLIFYDIKEDGKSIRPFIFKTRTLEGVEVYLAVGFTRPIPTQNEVDGELEETRYSSLEAGWTVLCNDRAVLYCDRTEMTGWGEANVPRYHTQFIAISGIVEFKADDASKLPTTTTKRGIDASSPLYLQIKNKMREGMRLFTDYTNKWKGRPEEAREQIIKGKPLSFSEIKTVSQKLPFSSTKTTFPVGQQYKPQLPLPLTIRPTQRRITFIKDHSDIKMISEYLFDSPEAEPSKVGEKCFDLILKDAQK